MLQNENNYLSINNFEYLDEMPYKIFEYLLKNKSKNAENLWKCLKYADKDCLSKPNLTTKEKKELIWTGQGKQDNFRVFNKPLVGDAISTAEEMTQLRIYEYMTDPDTKDLAYVLFRIDIETNETTNGLYNDKGIWVEKTSFIKNSCLLPLLNGVDLGIGFGALRFDKDISRRSQSIMALGNSKNFYGMYLMMALQYSNIDTGGTCG